MILIYLVLAATMNAIFFLIFGLDGIALLPRMLAIVASNIFLWFAFRPLWQDWERHKTPAVAAAQSFSALSLIASFVWHGNLHLLVPDIATAVTIGAIGLFVAVSLGLGRARDAIPAGLDGKNDDLEAICASEKLVGTVDRALEALSRSAVTPIVHELERLQRRARRKEFSAALCGSPSVEASRERLMAACMHRDDLQEIEAAANGLIASVSKV